jgi:hypothetical protein
MGEKRIDTVVSLLRQVADGLMDADRAIREWPSIDQEKDKLIAASWHDLSHFSADADIRGRDEKYDAFQRQLLRDRADAIRQKYGRA